MRGTTLVETLLALFLLMCATLLVVSLFHTSFRRSRAARLQVAASLWADELLDEATLWAQDPAHFAGDWAPLNGLRSHPQFPLQARLRSDLQVRLYSPCEGFESVTSDHPRVLSQSLARVQIDVGEGPGHTLVTVWTLLDEPARPLGANPVAISRTGSDPIARDASDQFEARLVDASGATIPDLTFDWSLRPGAGNAQFVDAGQASWRDGSRIDLINQFKPPAAPLTHVMGDADVRATCRYRVKNYSSRSPVQLGGPSGP